MKKKVLSLLIAILIILPCAFGFTACVNRNKSGTPAQIVGIEVIVKNNFDSPNYYSCVWDNINGNKEVCTLDDVKVYYKYSDGNRKEIDSDKYSYMRIDPDGSIYTPRPWTFFEDGESSRTSPGIYKMRFYSETKKYTADLAVEIFKAERPDSELHFYINKYTNELHTAYESTKITGQDEIFEISLFQNIFDGFPYFFTASGLGLEEKNIKFFILNDSEDYYNAVDKNSYIRNNKIGICDGVILTYTDGTPLLPGDYLVFAQYDETNRYTAGYSKPAKIRILPKFVNIADNAVSKYNETSLEKYGSPHIYQDIIYNFANQKSNKPFNLEFVESIYYTYLDLNFFDGTSWQKQNLSTFLFRSIKVHAFEDETNNKLYLADYVDGEWYKHGTTTKVSSSSIKFVDFDEVENYNETQQLKTSIFLSINLDKIKETEKQYLPYYQDINEIFKIDLELTK